MMSVLETMTQMRERLRRLVGIRRPWEPSARDDIQAKTCITDLRNCVKARGKNIPGGKKGKCSDLRWQHLTRLQPSGRGWRKHLMQGPYQGQYQGRTLQAMIRNLDCIPSREACEINPQETVPEILIEM